MSELYDDKSVDPVVHLNYSGITDINEIAVIRNYPDKIKYLYLKRNRLKILSLSIHQLSNLLQIHLEGNGIEVLPDEIGELKHLEVVNVVSNRLTCLPVTIGDLLSLRVLQVCNNEILTLPKELGTLQCLETLEATRNQLSNIPEDLYTCTKVRLLALDKNFIRQFPRQLCWLPNLADLSLVGNCLEYLPAVIFTTLTKLECINVENNYGVTALPKQCHSKPIVHVDSPIWTSRSDLHTYPQYISVDNVYVAIPHELNQLCVPNESCVPCLEELSMRMVHRHIKHTKDAEKLSLPVVATDHLMYPTAYCLHCNMCIFKSAFPVIYQEQGCRLLTLEFCCSYSCLISHNFHGCLVKYPVRIT